MLQKGVAVWVKSYNYLGLGIPAPDKLTGSEQEYTKAYTDLFLEPATRLLLGSVVGVAEPADINRLLQTIKTLKIKSWIYTLRYVATIYAHLVDVHNVRHTLQCVYDRFEEDYTEVILGAVPYKTTLTGYCDESGRVVGDYPVEVVVIARKEVLGDYKDINELARVKSSELTGEQRHALRKAVDAGFLQESFLAVEELPYIQENGVQTGSVNVMTDGLPPACVLKFLNTMPAAVASEGYVSKLHQAFDILDNSDSMKSEHADVYDWLSKNIPASTSVQEPLTDDSVNDYLFKHYGVTLTDVVNSKKPVAKELYTSALLMSEDAKGMNAADFVEMVNSDSDEETMTGTLDDLIIAFCKEEGISHECSIAQLIHAINYEGDVIPTSFVERAIKYKADEGIDGDTTINEIIKGEKHVHTDEVTVTVELIKACPNIDSVFKQRIIRCLMDENEKCTSDGMLIALLETIEMPDDVRDLMEIAIKTDGVFTLPEIKTPTVTEESEVVEFDDVGLAANECMLKGIRKLLTVGVDGVSDDDVRIALLPLVYAYFRILMLKSGEEDEAVEYLNAKLPNSTDYVRPYIEQAITLFNQR